jgi:hypothetical protein
MLFAVITLLGALTGTANAAGQPKTPLAVAQAAFRAARASHTAINTSELTEAAIRANFNVAVDPHGYVASVRETLPNDKGIAMLVNDVHGGFGCVHISPAATVAPKSARCPAPFLFAIDPNPTTSAKFLLADQVAGAIAIEATYASSAKTGTAVSAAVPKILRLVSGVSARHNALAWTIGVRNVSVCLTFSAKGTYLVRFNACA